ncbi:tetratricopeptide repeat protein [Vreelandella sp. EE27]
MKKSLYRALCSLATVAAALTLAMPTYAIDEGTQAAKDEGMRLWGIHQWETMQPPLEIAAEAGDVESMYYLGEANRLLSRGLSNAAMDWYYQAALHGEPYAMLRLDSGGACKLGGVCPEDGDDWRDAALEVTLPKAEDGDPEAMMALYSIYAVEDSEAANHWLLEAAEADNVYAQDWLGRRIRDGESGTSYTNDTERLESAEAWFRRAAEQGYGPSMNRLSVALMQLNMFEESYEWLERASDSGVMDARQHLAWCYIEPEHSERCLNDQNIPAGVGIFEAIEEETGDNDGQFVLNKIESSLTNRQRVEADSLKSQWLNHKSSLSYFPAKFGY